MAHWVGDSESLASGAREGALGGDHLARLPSADPDSRIPKGSSDVRDQRCGRDRRAAPTRMLSRYTLIGRRGEPRRDAERVGIYVDRLSPRAVVIVLIVFSLSMLDAVFTLSHLGRGGREANPVMNWAIEMGPVFFIVIKCLLTMAGMVLLVLHRYFRGVRGLLLSILGIYTGLMAYHLYLTTIL
jgi:Domain of unknown function (DUF5658)